jgi:chromosome segregation ATPase
MKNRTGLIILAVICLILGIATLYVKRQAAEQQRSDSQKIQVMSNNWAEATMKWEDQKQVSATLEQDLEKARKVQADLSNNLTQVNATLEKTAASLQTTESTLATTQTELKKSQDRITELETANQALDRQAAELSLSITNLTLQIADTQRKLATSEGDKALLEKELKRLMSEKAELERQFNDLAVLRAQVAKLKEELNIARRIEWIRQGILSSSDQKGATKLVQGFGAQQKPAQKSYDLNVEVKSDGSVNVAPATNAPAAK